MTRIPMTRLDVSLMLQNFSHWKIGKAISWGTSTSDQAYSRPRGCGYPETSRTSRQLYCTEGFKERRVTNRAPPPAPIMPRVRYSHGRSMTKIPASLLIKASIINGIKKTRAGILFIGYFYFFGHDRFFSQFSSVFSDQKWKKKCFKRCVMFWNWLPSNCFFLWDH